MPASDLSALIGAESDEGHAAALEGVVFGSADPDAIAEQLRQLCSDHLGASVAGAHFYRSSVGCVVGLRLSDGSDVVLKAHQSRLTKEFLERVVAAQTNLAEGGFPCPRPLAGPVPLKAGYAIIESFLADPGHRALDHGSLAVSAAGLADQIRRARHIDWAELPDHPMDPSSEALYPEPHSPLFDFEATSAGAEWIDRLAARATQRRVSLGAQRVLAHCDWARRNVRLGPTAVEAVYDWDSLAWVEETTAVGQAAATWNDATGDEDIPAVQEMAAFVRAYEAAADRRFDDGEIAAIGASALYLLAYAARCEHAIDPDGRHLHRSRSRLSSDADRILDLPRRVRR